MLTRSFIVVCAALATGFISAPFTIAQTDQAIDRTAPHPAVAPAVKEIDAVVDAGPFQSNWKSLEGYEIPQWYKNAKFGIFIHWGAYSVPAFGSEWYPRQMYIDRDRRGDNFFQHHAQQHGSQKEFGYKDFIPQFKAQNFDAQRWAKLFKDTGARYVIPVAEHHDGFPMYDCAYTRWDATEMGPKRDIIQELATAVRAQGMKFGVSSHRAFNWMFYVRDKDFDNVDPQYADLYGRAMPFLFGPDAWDYQKSFPPQDDQFKDDWLARSCELVDKYQPDVFWFDFGIAPDRSLTYDKNHFAEHLQRFSAYYYNQSKKWGKGIGIINYKWNAYPEGAAVLDKERSKMAKIRRPFWQTDTAVSASSWGYTQNQRYKTADRLVDDLVDIVSKNGCLLLNVGPRPDGTIPEEDQAILKGIGAWLKINGEAIYDTTYWKTFGEGPTGVSTGHVAESKDKPFTAEDLRFTFKNESLYVTGLAWPANDSVTVKSLAEGSAHYPEEIESVSLLGSSEQLDWSRGADGLTVKLPKAHPSEYAYVLKVRPKPPKFGDGKPVPPTGYKWVKNEAYSDEFNGTELDSTKWHDHYPGWPGRVPGKFLPENVSVKDGTLQIKSGVLDPPEGEFNIGCGAIQSKAKDALYGYYECRVKASSIRTSTTFWLFCKDVKVPGGKLRLELDIQECIGNATRWPGFKEQLRGNTHVTFTPGDNPQGAKNAKRGMSGNLKSKVDEEFHTYGCWWIDANTMKFFADGEYKFTIRPSTELDETPFDHPMFLNLVCETYEWEVPPEIEGLNDDSKNTTYYDYVRSWKLVKDNAHVSTAPPSKVSSTSAVASNVADNKPRPTGSGFPFVLPKEKPSRPLSAAMERNYDGYPAPRPESNDLFSQFKFTKLKGFDYHGGDGTVSRRDPSKVIFANGRYYVWYTKRDTPTPPQGAAASTDTIPSSDWDLCDIWYATSTDGFTWKEEGVAVPRPPKPRVGWRSVSTTDILQWKGKYYLYYQGFMEASGKRGDDCPVAVSWSNSPDGPWKPHDKIVIPNGGKGDWDQYSIHDPYPLVYKGKIYLYYKSDFDGSPNLIRMQGLATADHPLGPFTKNALNPVITSGHETTLFPYKQGIAALVIRDGNEHNTVQFAEDGVNFKIASITGLMPNAGGPFIADAFTDTKDGRGITWGISHFTNATTWKENHAILARFDCDLSQDVHDPDMKRHHVYHRPDVYFRQGLNGKQRKRVEASAAKMISDSLPAEIAPSQAYWYHRYKTQPNVPDPAKQLMNTEAEPDLKDGFTDLFNGHDLTGWTAYGGKCKFEVKDGAIKGTCVPGSKSTYLCTDRSDFGDFVFTCDLKWLIDGNTGVMFRAKVRPRDKSKPDSNRNREVFGPQAEMEEFSKGRFWSGGIYGQSCGGYFYPLWLKAHVATRTTLKQEGWNRLTISARGNEMRTWVNGVPMAVWTDDGTYADGFFGLQIHAGRQGTVLFKNIRVRE